MVKRVLIGQFPDGGYGIRVSQPGYDVTSNPVDNEKLIFNSDWQSALPVHAVGTIAVNNNTVTQTFADLGYIPHSTSLINDGEWQQYVTANSIIAQTVTIGTAPVSTQQLNVYNYDENEFTNLRINVLSGSITVFCAASVTVFYTIYKLRAF